MNAWSRVLTEKMRLMALASYRRSKRMSLSHGESPWRQSVHYRKDLFYGAMAYGPGVRP